MPISAAPVHDADDRRLGERRVDHPPGPELLLEALRDLEGAAVDADVLADHEDALVAPHLEPEPVGDRLEVGELGHLLVVGRVEVFGRGEHAVARPRRVRQRRLVGALDRVGQQLLDVRGELVLLVVAEVGVVAQPGAEALDRVGLRPTPRTCPSGRRTRRRGRRGPPCAASRTRSASARRPRAPSRSRAWPRGRRRARRCRRRPRPRSRRPAARSAMCSLANSRCDGVEYAHWLLSQMNTIGRRRTPASFIASCVSPRADAPSPNQPTATRGSSRMRKASAHADRDREHRRQVADHRDRPEAQVAQVDVAVLAPASARRRGPCTGRRSATARSPRTMWTPRSRCSGAPTSSGAIAVATPTAAPSFPRPV